MNERIVLGVVGLAALAAIVLPLPIYILYVGNLLLTYAVLAIGLDVLLGMTGQFAFAHIAFYGIGVYTAGIVGNRIGLSFPIPLLAGAVLAAAVAFAIAIPALRLHNIYLALTTFAFASAAQWVFRSWDSLTGGVNGLRLASTPLLGWHVVDDRDAYPVLLAVAVLMILLRLGLQRSKLGRSMAAVREAEPVALTSGIDVRRVKIAAFTISGFFAGAAGGMLPLFQSYVHPDSFGLETLVFALTIVVVGGLGSLGGILVGVIVMGLLPEILREAAVFRELIYGAILILSVTLMPRGIGGLIIRRGE